ncbi:hypothetical protein BC834DRAFT_862135 [Gloeopeniophorella convolvens]|nr:hypothetical protein BC834DRAFT_862135 [Gloeopeniophorella convolvens]
MTATLGEADAKFPNQEGEGIPPSPTRENPGKSTRSQNPHGPYALAAPYGTVPGSAESAAQKMRVEEAAEAKEEVRRVSGKLDPRSAESGGMFTD